MSYIICTTKPWQPMQQPISLWEARKSKPSKIYLKIVNELLVVQFGC